MAKVTKTSQDQIEIVRPPLSRTFDVPKPDDLLHVFEGDSVKLIFKGDSDVERMWVTVTQAGKMDHWTGTLDNDPIMPGLSSRIQYGDKVRFHPYDVIDIDLHRRIDQRDAGLDRYDDETVLENKIVRPWYKNAQIITALVVGLIGAIATIVAALL